MLSILAELLSFSQWHMAKINSKTHFKMRLHWSIQKLTTRIVPGKLAVRCSTRASWLTGLWAEFIAEMARHKISPSGMNCDWLIGDILIGDTSPAGGGGTSTRSWMNSRRSVWSYDVMVKQQQFACCLERLHPSSLSFLSFSYVSKAKQLLQQPWDHKIIFATSLSKSHHVTSRKNKLTQSSSRSKPAYSNLTKYNRFTHYNQSLHAEILSCLCWIKLALLSAVVRSEITVLPAHLRANICPDLRL